MPAVVPLEAGNQIPPNLACFEKRLPLLKKRESRVASAATGVQGNLSFTNRKQTEITNGTPLRNTTSDTKLVRPKIPDTSGSNDNKMKRTSAGATSRLETWTKIE